MRYLPHTQEDIQQMLQVAGAADLEALFSSIPDDCRRKDEMNLPEPLTEWELNGHMDRLAADGVLRPVSLFKLPPDQVPAGKRVMSAETARRVRHMLESVVSREGTAPKAAVSGYRVAGKTGTAWKFGMVGYSQDKYISIFAGLAPASDPRLATVVVIDEPGGELYYGSDVAAPVFADVMSESLRLLAIAPDALPARDPGSVVQAVAARPESR